MQMGKRKGFSLFPVPRLHEDKFHEDKFRVLRGQPVLVKMGIEIFTINLCIPASQISFHRPLLHAQMRLYQNSKPCRRISHPKNYMRK